MSVLHNRISNKELKEKLYEENFPRTTISFYQYFTIQDPLAFRDELYKDVRSSIFLVCIDAERSKKVQFAKDRINEIRRIQNHTPIITVLLDNHDIRFKNS